jgi:hypothetical protein
MNRFTLANVLTFILGLVFLLASLSKIGNMKIFYDSLAHLNILPVFVRGMCLLIIPGLELALGTCFLFRILTRASAVVAAGSLLCFIIMAFCEIVLGQTFDCGCFHLRAPAWLQLTGWWVIARNVILFVMCLIIIKCDDKGQNGARTAWP